MRDLPLHLARRLLKVRPAHKQRTDVRPHRHQRRVLAQRRDLRTGTALCLCRRVVDRPSSSSCRSLSGREGDNSEMSVHRQIENASVLFCGNRWV